MKTIKELAETTPPTADGKTCAVCNWTNVSLLNLGEPGEPRWVCPGCCKRAFDQAVPPSADGKTPGQVDYEAFVPREPGDWESCVCKQNYERSASAVLAAFGGQVQAEAQAKLDYVHNMGLRFGMMTSSDKPAPYLAHTWTEDSDHERMFREWSASIGGQWFLFPDAPPAALRPDLDFMVRHTCSSHPDGMADKHGDCVPCKLGWPPSLPNDQGMP